MWPCCSACPCTSSRRTRFLPAFAGMGWPQSSQWRRATARGTVVCAYISQSIAYAMKLSWSTSLDSSAELAEASSRSFPFFGKKSHSLAVVWSSGCSRGSPAASHGLLLMARFGRLPGAGERAGAGREAAGSAFSSRSCGESSEPSCAILGNCRRSSWWRRAKTNLQADG